MALFLRVLEDKEKGLRLGELVSALRNGQTSNKVFECSASLLREIPGSPFAYWVSEETRSTFGRLSAFESLGRNARQGLATADDSRFLRLWWEANSDSEKWLPFAKGGAFAPVYGDIYLAVNWANSGAELIAFAGSVIRNPDYYFRPGLTWSLRTKSRLSMRVLPLGCVFSHKGPGVFCEGDDQETLLAVLGICSTAHFYTLVEVQLAAADAQLGGAAHSFEVGVIQKTPVPMIRPPSSVELSDIVKRIWNLERRLFSVKETSRHFLLPSHIQVINGLLNEGITRQEVRDLRRRLDELGRQLYGFDIEKGDAERLQFDQASLVEDVDGDDEEGEGEPADDLSAVNSWCVGVAFGRFSVDPVSDRLGQVALETSNPFEPLPLISPGMLGERPQVLGTSAGILVDDAGDSNDIIRYVEDVLLRVEVPVQDDLRMWLRKEFFSLHLQQYSKSRRKAPIYWPLSTASGRYTVWLYYPKLSAQTLYTTVNDFIEPKLERVGSDVATLRNKAAARTREDESKFEELQSFELELVDLRSTLLELASRYKPNHSDGVQISAAPLWPLFRHKPWQKILKDTWAKLEKGDYDWAHLAMNYWPDRVREKCKTDKSLAIAHGLEQLYVEPEAKPKKTRGRKKAGDAE